MDGEAPKKVAVWFENSAHLHILEEPGHVFAALLEHVRRWQRKARRLIVDILPIFAA